jgi:replicative DNA helicase
MQNKPTLRTPPNEIGAEQAVLASILVEDKSIDKVLPILTPEDFYHPFNKHIYKHLLELHNNNKPLDIVTLSASLNETGEMDKAGGMEYVSSLVSILPNASNIVYYAEIVKDKSLLRHLIKTSSDISEKAYNYSGNVTELVDEAEKRIFSLAEYKVKKDVAFVGDILKTTIENLELLYNNKDEITGVPTGFTDLDKMINGMQNSDLIIIAGRPAMGKTAFALNVALNSARISNSSVAVFSLEMSSQQLVQRLLSSEARVDASKLRSGRLNERDWTHLTAVSGDIDQLKIFIDDTPAINITELRAKCRRLKREHDLNMVIIDYLQLMSGGKIENREQQISEISRSLKALAKELDIPVIALSQLNRSVEGRNDKRPLPSDLRESGAIEQDADIIIFLYRDEVYHKDTKEPGVAEIIIAKHRHGPTGVVKLTFIKEYTRFEDMAYTTV